MTVDEPAFSNDWIAGFVDAVLDDLPPFETALYLFLVRHSLMVGAPTATVGKRTIAKTIGVGKTGGNFAHINKRIDALVERGLIRVGETSRQGTVYVVNDYQHVSRYACAGGTSVMKLSTGSATRSDGQSYSLATTGTAGTAASG